MSNISDCKRYVRLRSLLGDKQKFIFKVYEDTDDVEIVSYINVNVEDNIGLGKNFNGIYYNSTTNEASWCVEDKIDIPEFVTKIKKGAFAKIYKPLKVNIKSKQIKSLEGVFSGYTGSSIQVYGDTTNLESMECMFLNCEKLKDVQLELNTREVRSTKGMFAGCVSLRYLDLSDLDTYNVRNMSYMFRFCMNLRELNLNKMDTHNVKTMAYMFSDCIELYKLNIDNFNTSKVKDMRYMFSDCINIKNINIKSFNTCNVVDMHSMFEHCYQLTDIAVKNIKFTSVRDLENMINCCGIDNKYLKFKIKQWEVFIKPIIKFKRLIRKFKRRKRK